MDFIGVPPNIGAVIRGRSPVTSLSYHSDGTTLFVASEEDCRLRLINCQSGTADRPAVRFEREGIRLVESTHHNHCVLYSGNGVKEEPPIKRHAVHYLSLHDNKILRNFSGHTGEISNISMSTVDDTFLTSGADRTVRLWSLEKAGCVAEMLLPPNVLEGSSSHAFFDSTGMVFGVSAQTADAQLINLYDARNYGAGPFSEMKVTQASIDSAVQGTGLSPKTTVQLSYAPWRSLSFNASGKQLLVLADGGVGFVVDGYEGTIDSVLLAKGAGSSSAPPLGACFTPDGQNVLGGNSDGTVTCWEAKSGKILGTLEGHTGPVRGVACNPKFAQFASSCSNTALWQW